MQKQLLFLELNEINFESVAFYCERGYLPNLKAIFRSHAWSETTSENEYAHLEPWIQWVTAHTGLTFAEHQVFRLGDVAKSDVNQIWELLESHGLRVGAISPMNANHRLKDPAFFVPDPWTKTQLTAGPVLRRLYNAIAQAVNDNAHSKLTASSAAALIVGFLQYARAANYAKYLYLVAGAKSHPWRRAMFLDLLLADVFMRETTASTPHFATLFLNAGAHIQHHYMFNSAAYQGKHKNPDWYVPGSLDPVLEVYQLYDHIVGEVRKSFPSARLMLATGLHQVPHGDVTYYWRLKNHGRFLSRLGIDFVRVEPRMSRDFLISFKDADAARIAESRLAAAKSTDGFALFDVDNRGSDLFVMLTYPREIGRSFTFTIGDELFSDLHEEVAFVALKNGEHSGTGYFVDTGETDADPQSSFPLTEIPARILSAFGIAGSKTRSDVPASGSQAFGAPLRIGENK